MLENSFPPIRIPNLSVGSIDLKNINLSVFSQGLYSDSPDIDKAINLGAQINILFEHWYNLESTVSAGIAKACGEAGMILNGSFPGNYLKISSFIKYYLHLYLHYSFIFTL